MQSFGSFFNDNKALALTLMLVAGIVAVGILIFLYRLLFGRRLHMTGGRTRQPRLGVVDAFDLDRQRQLVLIRRDNVEHLVMIGGPNDLVIESAFVRMQPNVALPLGREKDGTTGVVAPMALPPVQPSPQPSSAPAVAVDAPGSVASPQPGGPTAPASRSAVPPLDLTEPIGAPPADVLSSIPAPAPVPQAPEPQPPAAPQPDPVPEAAPQGATRPATASRFASSFPPRQLGTAGGALPPRPPLPSLRTTPPAAGATPRAASPGPRPLSTMPLTRGTSAASLRRDPPAQPAPGPEAGAPPPEDPAASRPPEAATPGPAPTVPETAPAAAPPAPATVKPTPSLPTTLDTLESLEEEMAKLLGRPAAGADKR